ncbi:MAG: transglutaminase-like domain-containing protein [Clostridium sp.]|nr:transglutaminase-like domain-containing protein [Acetatifactor muris]MCM1526970.1 transglutaminase-like domain-containing protein [Bacteroides sp.]MCM1563133.1 transglutaminase-like domain-containing protein [Clostridium sp.]
MSRRKLHFGRAVAYVSGVLGSFPIVREFISMYYEGSREDARSFVLCCALFWLLWTRGYAALYCAMAVAVLICPLMNIPLSLPALSLLLCSFVCARAGDRHRAVTVVCGTLAVVVFLGGFPGYRWSETLSQGAAMVDRYVNRIGVSIFGESDQGRFENGNVSRGNNYRNGSIHLEMALDRAPTEAIYLRGYVGADYRGDRWTEADESDFYGSMARLRGAEGSEAQFQAVQEHLYFILNYGDVNEWLSIMSGRALMREDVRKMVVNRSGAEDREYLPYFSIRAQMAEQYYELEEGQEVETFFYFEQADMDSDKIRRDTGEYAMSTQLQRREYDRYVRERYLDVPTGRLSELTELCNAHALSDVEEVTGFIRETVQRDSEYTLTPGNTPLNRDVIEYFLFDNRQGFCMHYASAATLMYRLYGIPARYVTGYVVHPSDFRRQADGTYAAAVTDFRLHAWVEIYQDNLGWTPV